MSERTIEDDIGRAAAGERHPGLAEAVRRCVEAELGELRERVFLLERRLNAEVAGVAAPVAVTITVDEDALTEYVIGKSLAPLETAAKRTGRRGRV